MTEGRPCSKTLAGVHVFAWRLVPGHGSRLQCVCGETPNKAEQEAFGEASLARSGEDRDLEVQRIRRGAL